MEDRINSTLEKSLVWKLLERFGTQGVQFIVQIVLARILDTELYGVLSLMIIFTNIANVFVQSGLNTALIQNNDVKEEDYSSVLWVSLGIAVILYCALFGCAPFIAKFYKMPEIVAPFRVLSLLLIPGAFNSVQLAIISRNMDFKQVFKSNIISILISGFIGIYLACNGAGLWALVAQNLVNVISVCIVMWFTVKWRPKLICNIARVKILFSFGWKLLVSSLLETLYQDLRSLVIGKKYDSGTLAYYNRGKQFPQFLINAINGAVKSVMLPAMSKKQDDKYQVKELMRNSIMMSSYIVFPMMAGLAAISYPLVKLLLTDKWLPCVPYMQIYCFMLAFYPVHSCNLQAINAMGRSDLFLKLEIIKKIYGIIVLIISVVCFNSPLAIAIGGLFATLISCFVNAHPNKELIEYSYKEQIVDMLPALVFSIIMYFFVSIIGKLDIHIVILLILQISIGVLVYLLFSIIFKPKSYIMLVSKIKTVRK